MFERPRRLLSQPLLPVVVIGLFAAYLACYAVVGAALTMLRAFVLIAFGLTIWTFVEYLVHRFVLHYDAHSKFGERLTYLGHGRHHENPTAHDHLVFSPLFSIPAAAAFYGLFSLLAGSIDAAPLFAGFVLGYVAYEALHYLMHGCTRSRIRLFLRLRQRHLCHHNRDEHFDFGVTTPIWDYVFRTRR